MLYLSQLLVETLAVPRAREDLIFGVLDDRRLGETLRAKVADYLADQDASRLAEVLMAGLAHEELKPTPAAWSTS